MKTRLTIVAVCDKQQERIDLGYATNGGALEASLARVMVYAMYWGRWMGQRIRIIAETATTAGEYNDVTDEACSDYVAKNGDSAVVVDALSARGGLEKKILDAEWEEST